LTDWGICNDNSAGYCFAGTDEKTLHATLLKWLPYVSFEIKPVLTVDQVIANINHVAAAAKKLTASFFLLPELPSLGAF